MMTSHHWSHFTAFNMHMHIRTKQARKKKVDVFGTWMCRSHRLTRCFDTFNTPGLWSSRILCYRAEKPETGFSQGKTDPRWKCWPADGTENLAALWPLRTGLGHPWFRWLYLHRYLGNYVRYVGSVWRTSNIITGQSTFTLFEKFLHFQDQCSHLIGKRDLLFGIWISWFPHIWLNLLFCVLSLFCISSDTEVSWHVIVRLSHSYRD